MTAILDVIAGINASLNAVVWGPPMLLLIVGTGVYLSVRTRFFQLTRFGHVLRQTFFAIFRKKGVLKSGEGKSISQFQALSAALAATTGTGNIAGVATAITIGGPGAIFWMWVSALFGMATGYAENALGAYFRKRSPQGEWAGGAMYYIEEGLGENRILKRAARPLAVLFALFCALASFGIGNMTQVNTISEVLRANFAVPGWATGLALSAATALVILGGVGRIVRVTEKLVPFMSLFYILATLVIFALNIKQISYVFGSILGGAFNVSAVAGGVGGSALRRAMTMGFKRGVFSNEAGLGSAPIVHAASDVREPAVQGMWAVFEVFFDTIVMCTLTAFALISTTTGSVAPPDRVNITPQPVLVSIAGLEEGEIPLIGTRPNAVLQNARDGGVIARLTVDGISRPVLLREPTRESDFTYANVMLASADDADGDGLAESVRFEEIAGASLVTYAFSRHFGSAAGMILALAVFLFAFMTVLGWSFYGVKATEYLLGARAVTPYKLIYISFAFLGALIGQNLAWDISDTLNGLMALPNLIGVLCLSGLVVRITRNYESRKITIKTPRPAPLLSAYRDIQRAEARALDREERSITASP